MKKAIKILGVTLGIFLLVLFLAPFLFKGSIEELLKKNINKNLNAQVDWQTLDISLFRNFPQATVDLENFSLINRVPFAGDTLASGERLSIEMALSQLFKKQGESITVDALSLNKGRINLIIDSLGHENFDIVVKENASNPQEEEATPGFTFDLKKYEIVDTYLSYQDQPSKTFLEITSLDHVGSGDFSLKTSELETESTALVSLEVDEIKYLDKNRLSLDAIFLMDLENQKYTFRENEAKINELPLVFDGFVQRVNSGTDIDLAFETPSSDFKNFLAVIPERYVKDISAVETTGDFTVQGLLKGSFNEENIPTMDIQIKSTNASFKYPDLPKTVRNISIDAQLKNDTGQLIDTFIRIGQLTFKIDDEVFLASGNISRITENALVDLALKGTLDLSKIEQVLPLELNQNLSGILQADITTEFDMKSIEVEAYQNVKTNGAASLSDFNYVDDAFNNPIRIDQANIRMSPGNITLKDFKAATGSTDVSGSGSIRNLIPWIMAKQDLKGQFTLSSNQFNLNDFKEKKVETTADQGSLSTAQGEEIKIPDFLDATVNFTAKKVLYDNIELNNVSGTIGVKDEQASLSNVKSNIFGGDIALSGNVNTKNNIPTFAMDLDLDKIDIDQSFGSLSLLKYLAPIASALDGNLNTNIKLEGQLNNDLTPNLATLAGNAVAQILTAEVDPKKAPVLSKIGDQVSFLDLNRLSLRDLNTAFSFSDGRLQVAPFDFDVKGINITAAGSHGLDKSMDYSLDLNVPARHLGGDISKLLQKLDPQEADALSVKVPVNLSGSFLAPQVSLNTSAAIDELTQKIIEKQKQSLKDKGTDILGDLIGGGNKPKDSTQATGGNNSQGSTTEVVKDILGGLFGKKKTKQDSTKSGNR